MTWRSRRNGFFTRPLRTAASRAALTLALAAAGLVPAAAPASAQMVGGFGRGSSGWSGQVMPGRGGGGSVWGRGGRSYPIPLGIPRWIEPAPSYVEDVIVVRPRRAPVAMDEAPRAAPKPRPAKKAVRQPATPAQVSARAPRPARITPPPQQYQAGEVVVELQRNASPAAAAEVAREYGLARISAQPISLLDTTLHRFRIRNGRPVQAVVSSLAGDVRVASAQPNFIFRLQAEAAGSMAGLQYARAKLRLPEAHELTKGDGVTVAVIDSGVDTEHPEIAGAVGKSLSALDARVRPDAHGTAIAGIIAAHAKLVGTAPAARLLPIEAFAADRKSGETRAVSTDIVRAISLSAEAGVRLANLSFAGPKDPLVSRAIAAAHGRGTIFVAAAGNGGPKAPPAYPAADPNVIGVTATDQKDALFASANRGTYVAFAAPGVDVLVAAPGKGYKMSSGTSMAAAHVTGVLALVMQKRPALTLDEARRVLAEGAKDLGAAGQDPEFGSGLVDARRTLDRASDSLLLEAQVVATVPPGE